MEAAEASPRRMARIAGVLYLVTIVAGLFAQGFVANRLVVAGDAAVTGANLLAHRTLFQAGLTLYLVEMAAQIAFIALFYVLLEPVSRSVSLVAAFLGVAGVAIKTVSRVFYIAPLLVLGSAHYAAVFSRQQLQSLALLFLQVNDHGAAISLAFSGFYALLTGYLIYRSTFLPRFLGAWSMVAGVGWLAFLSPPLGYRLFPYLAAVGFLGAAAIIVWLLVFGVNEERWRVSRFAADAAPPRGLDRPTTAA